MKLLLSELVRAGADLNEEYKLWMPAYLRRSPTLVETAVFFGSYDVVKLFLEAGADANRSTAWARQAGPVCAAAALSNSTEMLELLIQHGADINLTSEYIFCSGNRSIVHNRLKFGFHINNHRNCSFNNHGKPRPFILHQEDAPSRDGIPVEEDTMLLLHAAGQEVEKKPEEVASLKNLCRKYIRRHQLEKDASNLFIQIPRLGLPTVTTKFLLYNMSLEKNRHRR